MDRRSLVLAVMLSVGALLAGMSSQAQDTIAKADIQISYVLNLSPNPAVANFNKRHGHVVQAGLMGGSMSPYLASSTRSLVSQMIFTRRLMKP